MRNIITESGRRAEAIRYAQARVDNLRAALNLCDYALDIYGNLVYEPGRWPAEKQELTISLREWETMLSLLSLDLPFRLMEQ